VKGAVSKGYEIAIQGSVPHHVATPVATPAGNNFSNNFLVTLSTVPMSARIYYTTDGTTPTTSSAIYTGAITVSGTTVLKALGVLNGYSNSSVMTEAYTLTAATPTADIPPGAYGPPQTVTISSTTTDAVVHYTTDGSTPTCASATGAVSVTASMTVKAIACKSNYTSSPEALLTYNIIANRAPSAAADSARTLINQ
jgi:hypothetical protein